MFAFVHPAVAPAEMYMSTGSVSTGSIPAPVVSKNLVRLDVPHIRQPRYLCVPTSAAMILQYFGESYDPKLLKKYAENYKPASKRNATFTYWVDMEYAIRQIGKRWKIRNYPKTKAGFEKGISDIRKSLRNGNPVMIDVHLGGGHTFVVMGYDDYKQEVYIRDPNLAASRSRILPYSELLASWHNHRFSNSRSAFFSAL